MTDIDPRQALRAPALLNRERAILEFNRRVLAQATRADVPLLERLRYICIVSSNMDEFFEVRFADYIDASRRPGAGVSDLDLEAVATAAHALIDEQYEVFNRIVMPLLAERDIVVLSHEQRSQEQQHWVDRFFAAQVRPLLVPVGLDPSHPFPQVANKSLNFIARLGGKDAFGRRNTVTILKVPRVLPRVIKLPPKLSDGRQAFVLLTSVIRTHLNELFPGREVEAFSQFRITRDSELEVDAVDVKNLRQALRSGLTARHFGQAVRLEVVNTCPTELSTFLLEQFGLPAAALYRANGPVNLVRLNELIDQVDAPRLRFASFEPMWPQGRLPRQLSMFARLRSRDVLLHHPFESFDPVVQFLREAVNDPSVLAIKQTIYRTGAQSPLMDLLIEGARRGKEVMAVVELQARFDEEANINWAERLEAVGAQVVYGVVGLKTHAKLLLVTRREEGKLRRYAHLSTGNYNPKTARLYTDIGYFSADKDLTSDADAVFQQLASLGRMKPLRCMLQAPFTLHAQMLVLIGKVSAAAKAGNTARIVVKINALTDVPLIDALVEAAQSGAEIDLIVRGACMLAPGVAGLTDRIRVRSVVGRFLEHSRIAYFRWGAAGDAKAASGKAEHGKTEHAKADAKSDHGKADHAKHEHSKREHGKPGQGKRAAASGAAAADEEALYLSSADWMGRNMFGRIEVAWPIRDAALRQRVLDECLVPYLLDRQDAWCLHADGSYSRVDTDGPAAQHALLDLYTAHP